MIKSLSLKGSSAAGR